MADHPELATVPRVDIQRYMGTWYEIARLPMRHEPEDATDVTAAGAHRHLDRVRDEIGAHVVGDGPAHHPA